MAVLPGSTEPREVTCIGDTEVVVNKSKASGGGVYLIPANPSLAIPFTLNIENCQLLIPNRLSLESKIRSMLVKTISTGGRPVAEESQILSRVLKIGIYILSEIGDTTFESSYTCVVMNCFPLIPC